MEQDSLQFLPSRPGLVDRTDDREKPPIDWPQVEDLRDVDITGPYVPRWGRCQADPDNRA